MGSGRVLLRWVFGRNYEEAEVDEVKVWDSAQQVLGDGPRGRRLLFILQRNAEGMTYEDIGRLCSRMDNGIGVTGVGLTRERIRQLEAGALIRLRRSRRFMPGHTMSGIKS